MTQLPPTYVEAQEAQALQIARQWIANCREGDFIGLGLPGLHPDAGRAFVRRMLRQGMHDANMMLSLLDLAYAGWQDARDALDDLIFECHNRHEPVTACLVEYATRARRGQLPPIPPKLRGVRKSTNILKDIFIVSLIMELIVVCRLRPTRHQLYKSRPCGCSVVAQAMTEAGLHRGGEPAVMKVWERYQASVLPGSRAEAVSATLQRSKNISPIN